MSSMETELLPDDFTFDHDSVQTLSERRPAEIPRAFIYSPVKWRSNLEEPTAEDIPVIDLATKSSDHLLSGDIGEASRVWGFFQVVNHGVPLELLQQMRQLMRDFYHEKPVEEKLVHAHTNYMLDKDGELPPEGFGSRYSKGVPLNWKDQFLHYTYPPSRRDLSHWPSDPPYYRPDLGVPRVRSKIPNRGIGRAAPEPSNQLLLSMSTTRACSWRPDNGSITILLQGDIPGLQVQKNDKWFTVQPIRDALVVNVGNMRQILSNDKYTSVQHRVFLHRDIPRQSVAAFHNVNQDRPIGPAKPLTDEDHPPAFREVIFGDHLRAFNLKGKNTAADGKRILDAYRLI